MTNSNFEARIEKLTDNLGAAVDRVKQISVDYDIWATEHATDIRSMSSVCGATRLLQERVKALLEEVNKMHGKQVNHDMPHCFKAVNATLPMKSRTNSITNGYGRFTVTQRTSWSILDKNKAFSWLKKAKLGPLIQPYVHPGTLSAALNSYSKENGKEPPPDIIKKQPHTQVAVTLSKQKTETE